MKFQTILKVKQKNLATVLLSQKEEFDDTDENW